MILPDFPLVILCRTLPDIINKYKADLSKDMVKKNECIRSNKAEAAKNKVSIDIEQYAYELWGVNLMHIPGINKGSLLKLINWRIGSRFYQQIRNFQRILQLG